MLYPPRTGMQLLPPLLTGVLVLAFGARAFGAGAERRGAVEGREARAAASAFSLAITAACFCVASDADSSDLSRAAAALVLAACSIWSSVLLSSSARWSARLLSFAWSRPGRVTSRLVAEAERSKAAGTSAS